MLESENVFTKNKKRINVTTSRAGTCRESKSLGIGREDTNVNVDSVEFSRGITFGQEYHEFSRSMKCYLGNQFECAPGRARIGTNKVISEECHCARVFHQSIHLRRNCSHFHKYKNSIKFWLSMLFHYRNKSTKCFLNYFNTYASI